MPTKREHATGVILSTVFLLAASFISTPSAALDCPPPEEYPDGTKIEQCYNELGDLVRKRIILPERLLTANKEGQGRGTVTSLPFGIDCGTDCEENYYINDTVTLTGTPDACSYFEAWTGGCVGTGDCTVTIDDDDTITAVFQCKAPIADFTSEYVTEEAPAFVRFTDLTANCPSSWLWDFGDGTLPAERTEQSPLHTYEEEGPYTVSLSVSSCGGSDGVTKIDHVRILPCPEHKVKIEGKPSGYSDLTGAYNASAAGDVIMSHAVTFTETLDINKTISINGGYDCYYTMHPGRTVIRGDVTVGSGTFTVTMDNLVID